MPVNLSYDQPSRLPPGLPQTQGNFYRAHGNAGLRDMFKTGLVRGTEKYGGNAYWSENSPLSRYAQPGSAGSGAIIESLPTDKIMRQGSFQSYPMSTPDAPVNRFTDPIRVLSPDSKGYMRTTYDNVTPWKQGLRSFGYEAVGNTGMRALGGIGDAAKAVGKGMINPYALGMELLLHSNEAQ